MKYYWIVKEKGKLRIEEEEVEDYWNVHFNRAMNIVAVFTNGNDAMEWVKQKEKSNDPN